MITSTATTAITNRTGANSSSSCSFTDGSSIRNYNNDNRNDNDNY